MGKRRKGPSGATQGLQDDRADRSGSGPRTGRDGAKSSGLTTGLFSGFADQSITCTVDGCERTWTWSVEAQVRAWGRPAPQGQCSEHRIEALELRDQEVSCRMSSCQRTWTWTAMAQLQAMGDDEREKPSPPARLCEPCHRKLTTLSVERVSCKVHGCTRTVSVSAEAQLKAWISHPEAAGDVTPKRMCESCRDFCRTHSDREVACERSGCKKTWTFKTGAQLQDFVAGRPGPPARLCDDCRREQAASSSVPARNDPVQVMPCVVTGCEGTWTHRHGNRLEPATEGTLPLDRMCPSCRSERGDQKAG